MLAITPCPPTHKMGRLGGRGQRGVLLKGLLLYVLTFLLVGVLVSVLFYLKTWLF